MSELQEDNLKNNHYKVGDIDTSKMDDKAGIHCYTGSARHLECAQHKEVDIGKGDNTGSWQIKEKVEI